MCSRKFFRRDQFGYQYEKIEEWLHAEFVEENEYD